jgi:hypothetical protein
MTKKEQLIEETYEILSGEDSDRACKAIPDDACKNVPRNYVLNVLNGASTKLAEQLAGPKVVLPWLLSAIGAPQFITGLLMPIKQAGSLIPQLIVSGQIREYPIRKWFWVGAGVSQSIFLILMIFAVLLFSPTLAGYAIVILLLLFSTASGVGSVAYKDVVGKTIDKGIRGIMLANRAAIGGVLTIGAGLVIRFFIGEKGETNNYLYLIGIAAVLWFLGAIFFAFKEEYAGATEGGRNAINEAKAGFQIFSKDGNYRTYLFAKIFLISIEISAPFYVLHSKQVISGSIETLGIMIIAVGLANIVSSPFWGKFADTSSKNTMIYAGLIGALTAIFALGFALLPSVIQTSYVYGIVFVLLGIAEAGVRLGRKTYLLDYLDEKDRPTYIAFANSSIGVVTLGIGALLGLVIQYFGIQILLYVLIGMGLVGSYLSLRLKSSE